MVIHPSVLLRVIQIRGAFRKLPGILKLLMSNPGKVFSTEEIFEGVWNEKMFEANNTVMVHIRRLREKVELNPRDAQIIKTVWGVGYKIEK